jgi:hypothetical protein
MTRWRVRFGEAWVALLVRESAEGRVFQWILSCKVNQVEVLLELVAFYTDLNLN